MISNRFPVSSILLLPVGEIPDDLLPWLQRQLAERFDGPVKIAQAIELPHAAFERRREQYLGDALLRIIRDQEAPSSAKILGIIDHDCYADGLNFIFGQAALKGREAFIALPRLRPTFYGLPNDEWLFRERVLKEALHELGHTLGFPHCADPGCVMHYSNTIRDTDRKGTAYCTNCVELLDKAKRH